MRLWTDLNWVRTALQDTATAVLLLLAATRSGARQPATSAAPAT